MKIKLNGLGFTLIELLVVISIIGLLSTLAVVSLNSARAKSRDAKRVADIKQIQTALEMHFADNNSYPAALTNLTPTYIASVPANPSPNGTAYTYTQGTNTYTLTFTLEAATGGYAIGLHTATPAGIQ